MKIILLLHLKVIFGSNISHPCSIFPCYILFIFHPLCLHPHCLAEGEGGVDVSASVCCRAVNRLPWERGNETRVHHIRLSCPMPKKKSTFALKRWIQTHIYLLRRSGRNKLFQFWCMKRWGSIPRIIKNINYNWINRELKTVSVVCCHPWSSGVCRHGVFWLMRMVGCDTDKRCRTQISGSQRLRPSRLSLLMLFAIIYHQSRVIATCLSIHMF